MLNKELNRKVDNLDIRFINIPNTASDSEVMCKIKELEDIIKIHNDIDHSKIKNHNVCITIDYEKINDAISDPSSIQKTVGSWEINS